MVQAVSIPEAVKNKTGTPGVEFLVFALYNNHLVAYKVETTTAFTVFNLKLQSKSTHLKSTFPDQLVLTKQHNGWQPCSDFEKELTKLIDTWMSHHLCKTGGK